MTTPIDQADLSLALVARAIEKAQGAIGVPALDKLHELFPATFAALATALTAAEADVKVLRGMNRGRQPMHPGLAASIEAVAGEATDPCEEHIHVSDPNCDACNAERPDAIECLACGKETVPVEGEPLVCPCGALLTTDGGS